MTKAQMRSIEAILAVLLILMAYSRITGSLYEASSPVRSLSLKADRILRTLKETGLLSKSIKEYDFKQASFLVSQILPIQYQHTLSTTFYVPIEIEATEWTNSNLDKNQSNISLTRNIPGYVDSDSIKVSSENYTLPTCVTENWKAIPITIWSEDNTADKRINITGLWMNVSSPNEVNLTSQTFYLRGEETGLNYTINSKEGDNSYNINLTIYANRLKQGSNNGIFYYAYNKTLKNEELSSFDSLGPGTKMSSSKPPTCPPSPTETCYSREPSRKAPRFDILFKTPLSKNSSREFYLTYSYGTDKEGNCSWDKTSFLNQSIDIETPEEKMVESTRPPSAQPQTISHSSSIFLSLEERRAEVTLEIWSQLV